MLFKVQLNSFAFVSQEINDLQDQLRDLMFYIDGQQKLKEIKDLSVDELETCQISVTSPTTANMSSTAAANATRSRRRKKQ